MPKPVVNTSRQTPPRLLTRPAACPRCEGKLADEPGAVRCVNCGWIGYLDGLVLAQQTFEQRSGMMSALSARVDRRTVGARHVYAEWDTAFT